MEKSSKLKRVFFITFCALILLAICMLVFVRKVFIFESTKVSYEVVKPHAILAYNSEENANTTLLNNENQVVYLSDIPYKTGTVGWGSIALDKTQDNTPLTLLLDGVLTVVEKGIWAHATSTLEYDISKYKDYAYFTTFYGLNNTSGNRGNGVKFSVYTSEDGKNWTLRTEENPVAIKSSNNAVRIKIDIREANYIKLYASDNGSNASDHAVWGDAKLVKEGYNDNAMQTVEEYDKLIKASYESGEVKDDLKLTLLQRNFIKNVG